MIVGVAMQQGCESWCHLESNDNFEDILNVVQGYDIIIVADKAVSPEDRFGSGLVVIHQLLVRHISTAHKDVAISALFQQMCELQA